MTFKDIVPYGLFKDDNRGFRHSIDKLIINYWFNDSFDFNEFCLTLSSSSSLQFHARDEEGYNSYFDKKPSSSYAWYANAFWFPHVNVKYGLYRRTQDFIGPTKITSWNLEKVLKLEFNPNKVFENDLFILVMCLIQRYAKAGILDEFDYSVDIPCKTNQIISQSRKDKIIYNDSRYYGKRHTNGRLKIYNKRKEILDKEKQYPSDQDCSRCEVTCKNNEKLQFGDIFYCDSGSNNNDLSSNLYSIAKLIMLASSYGEDKEELLSRYVKDKRNRDKLKPVLFGKEERIFDINIALDLLSKYCALYKFIAKFENIIVNERSYEICNI